MSTKPAKLPAWNTGASNNVEPTAGEKITGWTTNQVPPSSYFNWLFYWIWSWIVYVSDGVFTGSGGTVGVEAHGDTGQAGINAYGGTGSTSGVIGHPGSTGGYGLQGQGGSVGSGVNGTASGTGFGAGDFAASGTAWAVVARGGTSNQTAVAAIGGSGGGGQPAVTAYNGDGTASTTAIDCVGALGLHNAVMPASNVARPAQVLRDSVINAQGYIEGTTLKDGFGVASISYGSNELDIYFAQAFSNVYYVPHVTCFVTATPSVRLFCQPNLLTTGAMALIFWDASGTPVNPNTGLYTVIFSCTGKVP